MCQGNKRVVECDYSADLLVSPNNRRGGCIVFGQNDATVVGGHLTNPGKRDRYSTVTAVPGIKLGLAFCEASGKGLVRWSGTDAAMIELAK